MKGYQTATGLKSVWIGHPRRDEVGGAPLASEATEVVDGNDAYIESAKYSVDYGRPVYIAKADSISLVARLGSAPAGADLSAGRLTLTVGGMEMLTDVALGADGQILSPNATGLYDRASGRMTLAVRGLDLSAAILTPTSVPLSIGLEGLSLETPVVATTLAFATTTGYDVPTLGKYQFTKSGTGSGVFRVTSAKATLVPGLRFRVRLVAALDAPGGFGPWTNGPTEFVAGSHEEIRASQTLLTASRNGSYYSFAPTGDLAKLRIDLRKRTLTADFTIALPPEFAWAMPGETVDVPLVFRTTPAGSPTQVTYVTKATLTR
jgi:hypothetical protein